MIRVWTPSRLHFGLLSLAAPGEVWTDRAGAAGLPARWFGGVGLMVEAPGVQVRAEPAGSWQAEGPLAERALAFAHRLQEALSRACPEEKLWPQRLTIEQAGPEHAGLGTGTQLALAVGRAVTAACGVWTTVGQLVRYLGRGLRSGLGAHGFEEGGLLVEAGKRQAEELGALVARQPFPTAWRIVLARPLETTAGLHGTGERDAFTRLAAQPGTLRQTEALCRLVLLGLLPAVVEEDLEAFGEALFDFNTRVGEVFAPVQGGTYAGPAVAELVGLVRGLGVRGVGQSSWGPTVFAVVADPHEADALARQIVDRLGANRVETTVTRACNHGAVVTGPGC
jgi:beta-RFAP synthase